MKSKKYSRSFLVVGCNLMLLLGAGTTMALNSHLGAVKYSISSQLFVDGKLIAQPQIVAYENQNASIVLADKIAYKDHKPFDVFADTNGNFIRVSLLAKPAQKNLIDVTYTIQYAKDKETVSAKGEVLLKPNQTSMIKLAPRSNHVYEVKMTGSIV